MQTDRAAWRIVECLKRNIIDLAIIDSSGVIYWPIVSNASAIMEPFFTCLRPTNRTAALYSPIYRYFSVSLRICTLFFILTYSLTDQSSPPSLWLLFNLPKTPLTLTNGKLLFMRVLMICLMSNLKLFVILRMRAVI